MEREFTKTNEVLAKYAEDFILKYRENMDAAGYDTTDRLYSDLSYEVVSQGDMFEIVIHLADYWIYSENGRGPGKMPPEAPILKWIEYKKILPRPMKLKNGKTVIPSVKSLAFMIRRKIANEGTVGAGLLEKTRREVFSALTAELKQAIKEDLMAMVFSDIKK